jgi:hypothetical protein
MGGCWVTDDRLHLRYAEAKARLAKLEALGLTQPPDTPGDPPVVSVSGSRD